MRCGRCGLWSEDIDPRHEDDTVGICLWYLVRMSSDEKWMANDCGDFMHAVEGELPSWHYQVKLQRTEIARAYEKARSAQFLAVVGVVLSLLGLLLRLLG